MNGDGILILVSLHPFSPPTQNRRKDSSSYTVLRQDVVSLAHPIVAHSRQALVIAGKRLVEIESDFRSVRELYRRSKLVAGQ